LLHAVEEDLAIAVGTAADGADEAGGEGIGAGDGDGVDQGGLTLEGGDAVGVGLERDAEVSGADEPEDPDVAVDIDAPEAGGQELAEFQGFGLGA
jgi:hypothetical protein